MQAPTAGVEAVLEVYSELDEGTYVHKFHFREHTAANLVLTHAFLALLSGLDISYICIAWKKCDIICMPTINMFFVLSLQTARL